jgi:gamma-glutamyltranspeptidase/glutathione hydrolase
VEREPLVVEHRRRRILTNPPPSFGGRLIALALALELQRTRRAAWGTPAWATELVEDLREVDRRRAAELHGAGPVPPPPATARGTTHVSVTDAEGNLAAMTTSNGECSGDLVPGTGILLNNMLGEDDLHPGGFHAAPPGVRVASMMAPTIVLGPAGEPELVLGSGGSKRIRTAIHQVVAAVVDGGLPVEQAVVAPRLHWDTDHVELEPGWDAAVVDALAARWPVNRWPDRDVYFGGVHAVVPGVAGGAAGDPRRDGAAAVI